MWYGSFLNATDASMSLNNSQVLLKVDQAGLVSPPSNHDGADVPVDLDGFSIDAHAVSDFAGFSRLSILVRQELGVCKFVL